MPRVCWIFEFPTQNGGENSLLSCLGAIRRAGFEPVALAPASGRMAETLRLHEVEVLDFQPRPPQPGSATATPVRRGTDALRTELAERLRELAPDLVHANSLATSRLVAPVTQELGLPALGHLRDIVKLSAAAIADLNRLDRVLAVSAATRDYHIVQGLNAERVHVQYNGVDLESFRPQASTRWLQRALGIPDGTEFIGAVGQLVMRKGHDVFLQAAAAVADELPNAHFVLIGERYSGKAEAREFLASLATMANTPPLTGRVHFPGYLPEMNRVLPELALLVHTARQEPLGRVLLEAAACGTPVIATDVGGTREIFPAGTHSAVLIPRDDVTALAAALRNIYQNEALRQQLSHNSRRRAENAFNVQAAAAGLVKHYQATCNSHHS